MRRTLEIEQLLNARRSEFTVGAAELDRAIARGEHAQIDWVFIMIANLVFNDPNTSPDLRTALHPNVQSPMSLRNRLEKRIRGLYKLDTAPMVLVVRKALDRFDQEATMSTTAANARIREIVEVQNLLRPEVGLSYGYIGNIYQDRDDRSFCVFTRLKDNTGRSVTYGGVGLAQLPSLLLDMECEFEAWLERLYDRFPQLNHQRSAAVTAS